VELIYLLSISSSTPKLNPSPQVFGPISWTGMQIRSFICKRKNVGPSLWSGQKVFRFEVDRILVFPHKWGCMIWGWPPFRREIEVVQHSVPRLLLDISRQRHPIRIHIRIGSWPVIAFLWPCCMDGVCKMSR